MCQRERVARAATAFGILNHDFVVDQFKDVAVTSEGWADKPSQTLTASLMGGGAGETPAEMSLIGAGANVGAGKGSGVGQGSGLGSGWIRLRGTMCANRRSFHVHF